MSTVAARGLLLPYDSCEVAYYMAHSSGADDCLITCERLLVFNLLSDVFLSLHCEQLVQD